MLVWLVLVMLVGVITALFSERNSERERERERYTETETERVQMMHVLRVDCGFAYSSFIDQILTQFALFMLASIRITFIVFRFLIRLPRASIAIA